MIQTLEVSTSTVSVAPLPIGDGTPGTDLIQIRNITGLEPVKADVNTTPYGSVDGASFDGANTPFRNIVLTVGLNPDWATQTFESLRGILYAYFMPQTPVKLRFTSTHMPTVDIEGYVESFSPNIFSKETEIQVSIICPQPYFVAKDESAVSGTTENLAGNTVAEFEYEGSVSSGFVVDIANNTGTAFTGEFRVVRLLPDLQIFVVQGTIDDTKSLEISTVERNKYVRSLPIPAAPYTSLLDKVTPGSPWLSLVRSTNRMQILTTTAGMDWTIRWYAKFGGL